MPDQPEFAAFFARLTQVLDDLPGVGPLAARRLARHLMQPDKASELTALLTTAADFNQCQRCHSYSAAAICADCRQADSDPLLLVEHADEVLFWREQGFCGSVFVLHGLLSPVAGIGPQQLQLALLKKRVAEQEGLSNLWMCLPDSVEGQTTVRFITDMKLQKNLRSWQREELSDYLQHHKGAG